jgi:hypothetical protein
VGLRVCGNRSWWGSDFPRAAPEAEAGDDDDEEEEEDEDEDKEDEGEEDELDSEDEDEEDEELEEEDAEDAEDEDDEDDDEDSAGEAFLPLASMLARSSAGSTCVWAGVEVVFGLGSDIVETIDSLGAFFTPAFPFFALLAGLSTLASSAFRFPFALPLVDEEVTPRLE